MKKVIILLVVAALFLGGCSGMSNTQQRVLSGGAIGASSGALIGWAAGSPAAGAAIGGGARYVGRISLRPVREISQADLDPATPRRPSQPPPVKLITPLKYLGMGPVDLFPELGSRQAVRAVRSLPRGMRFARRTSRPDRGLEAG